MRNVVIVDSVRTGLAKSHRGGFNMTRPDEMLAHIIDAMLDRNPDMPPEAVEDIIMGCGNPEGAQGHNCLLYTSPSPRDRVRSRMPSSA